MAALRRARANLNGKLTLGENTADNGGIRIAYLALENTLAAEGKNLDGPKSDGFTPAQRFFIAFGQIWCEKPRGRIRGCWRRWIRTRRASGG